MAGTSLHELLVWMTVIAILAGSVAPDLVRWRQARTLEAGAQRIAMTFVGLRAAAATEGRAHALALEVREGHLAWQRLVDGDGDGIRSSDLARGIDSRVGPLETFEPGQSGVLPGLPPGGVGPGGTRAPSHGIVFGAASMLVAGPDGTASSGTLYLRNRVGDAAAIRVYGPTARLTVWLRRAGEAAWERAW